MSLRDTLRSGDRSWYVEPNVVPLEDYQWLLWSLVVVSLVLDVATTTYGLQRGLAEANPIARQLFARFDPLGAMLALKGIVLVLGVVVWLLLPQRYRGFVPLGVALPWTFAGVFNLTVLARVVL